MGKQRAGCLSRSQVKAIENLIGEVRPTDNSFCRWLENKHQIPAGTVRTYMRLHGMEFFQMETGGCTIRRVKVLA